MEEIQTLWVGSNITSLVMPMYVGGVNECMHALFGMFMGGVSLLPHPLSHADAKMGVTFIF